MLYPTICFLSILYLVRPSVQDCRVLADCDGGTAKWEKLHGGLPGPKGEPGCGCDNQEEPKLYFSTNTLPYANAESFCNNFGRYLCRYSDICIHNLTTSATELINHAMPGDHWVPIADKFNEWVQIGDHHVDACFRSTNSSWGLSSDNKLFKGYVYCCPAAPPSTIPDMVYDYGGQGTTYASSKAHCEWMNMRLCYGSQICQGSTPKYGVLNGDMWVAIQDSHNDWIQIGNKPHNPCIHHLPRLGSPKWGIRTDNSQVKHVGYIYCCTK